MASRPPGGEPGHVLVDTQTGDHSVLHEPPFVPRVQRGPRGRPHGRRAYSCPDWRGPGPVIVIDLRPA